MLPSRWLRSLSGILISLIVWVGWSDPSSSALPPELTFRVTVSAFDGQKLVRHGAAVIKIETENGEYGRFAAAEHGLLEFTIPTAISTTWTLLLGGSEPARTFEATWNEGILRIADASKDDSLLPYSQSADGGYCFEYYCDCLYICRQAEDYAPIAGRLYRNRDVDSAQPDLSVQAVVAAGWTGETIDSAGDVGQYSSLALDGYNKAHVSYYDVTNANMKYATNSSGGWSNVTVDDGGGNDVGIDTTIALDGNGKAHIAYQDYDDGFLKYATNSTGAFGTGSATIQTVDNDFDAGWFNSLDVDSSGKVHIAYGSGYFIGTSLKYASNSSGPWYTTNINVMVSDMPQQSMMVDSSGRVHIAYANADDRTLVYAVGESGTWTQTVIETLAADHTARRPSLALDSAGKAHISCLDYDEDGSETLTVNYYTNTSGAWVKSPIGSAGKTPDGVGLYTSLAVDNSGNCHVAYYYNDQAGTKNLVYATNSSGAWATTVVDDAEGSDGSLALDCCGNPHIIYYDETNDDLKYVYYGSCDRTCAGGGGGGSDRPDGGPYGRFGGGGSLVLGPSSAELSAAFNKARREMTDLMICRVIPFSPGYDGSDSTVAPASANIPGLLIGWTDAQGASGEWWLGLDESGRLSNGFLFETKLGANYDVACAEVCLTVPATRIFMMTPGTYTLSWWIVSADGARSNIRTETFTID